MNKLLIFSFISSMLKDPLIYSFSDYYLIIEVITYIYFKLRLLLLKIPILKLFLVFRK